MTTKATQEQLSRIRADALFGKKKHYNAADRKERIAVVIGVFAILINVAVGSALFALLKEVVPEWAKWLGALLSLSAAGLGAVQTYLAFHKAVPGHRGIGGRYLALLKKCDRLSAYYVDGLRDQSMLARDIEDLAHEIEVVNVEAHSFPTSAKDIQLARESIERGEEQYTEQELSRSKGSGA